MESQLHLGYNGELHEPGTQWQILGNGHRAYNPVFNRFHRSDAESPFGDGGVNSYAYCANDPINFADPTGRFLQYVALVLGAAAVGSGIGALTSRDAGDTDEAGVLGALSLGLGIAASVSLGVFAYRRVAVRSRASNLPPALGPHDPKMTAHGDSIVFQSHSGPFATRLWDQGKFRWVSGGKVGRKISEVAGAQNPGAPIRLISCYSGFGGKVSQAQRVADVTGRNVYGYKGMVYTHNDGWMAVKPGAGVLFRPQRGIARARTMIVNEAANAPVGAFMQALERIRRLRAR